MNQLTLFNESKETVDIYSREVFAICKYKVSLNSACRWSEKLSFSVLLGTKQTLH